MATNGLSSRRWLPTSSLLLGLIGGCGGSSVQMPAKDPTGDARVVRGVSLDAGAGRRGTGTDGTVELFNGRDLAGWKALQGGAPLALGSNLVVDHGELVSPAKAKGRLATVRAFENFSLRLEYLFPAGGTVGPDFSSGIALWRADGAFQVTGWPDPGPIGVQLKPGNAGNIKVGPHRRSAVSPHQRAAERPVGSWNEIEIQFVKQNLAVMLNGERVNEARAMNPGPAHICLLAFGSDVRYRNIRLAPLAAVELLASNSRSASPDGAGSKTTAAGLGPGKAKSAGRDDHSRQPPYRPMPDGNSVTTAQPRRDPHAPPQKGLTAKDVALLKLAASRFYLNRDVVTLPENAYQDAHGMLVKEAFPPRPDGPSKLAALILIDVDLAHRRMGAYQSNDQLVRSFPDTWRETAVESLFSVLPLDEFPTLAEIRNGPGRDLDEFVDKMRENETNKALLEILSYRINVEEEKLFLEYFRPKLGEEDLSSRNMLRISPVDHDDIGIPTKDGPAFFWFKKLIEVAYLGDAPLTNVVVVGRLLTTGPSTTLNQGQLQNLAFNAATGYSDKNPAITEMFKAQNYLGTMRKTNLCVVPVLKHGDVIRLPVGRAEEDVLIGGEAAIYCDQGYLPEVKVVFKPPSRQSSSKAGAHNKANAPSTNKPLRRRR